MLKVAARRILVAQDPARLWKDRDRVCLYAKDEKVACGIVTKSNSKGAIVEIDEILGNVAVADKLGPDDGKRRSTKAMANRLPEKKQRSCQRNYALRRYSNHPIRIHLVYDRSVSNHRN